LVVLRSDELTGFGYSAHRVEAGVQQSVSEVVKLLSALPMELGALLRFDLDRSAASIAADWPTRLATNAIALAAWDLAARRAGVSCAAAWGGGDVGELDCYASSGFYVNVPEDELAETAARARREHFRHVNVRAGLVPADDARRVGIVREQFPEKGAVAVDALHGWSVGGTRAFVEAVDFPLMWVEDPVGDDQLGQLKDLPQPIAAGELMATHEEVLGLTEKARVDIVLPDVMVVGSPAYFLLLADKLRSANVRVGAHLFPEFSAHLLACVDEPGPVEVFSWSDPLFEETLRPGPSGRLPVIGPGFGMNLDQEAISRLGDRVSVLGG
jgi:L-alanine-DL-glutamate epimerase-like enolase superfamily enzyme